METNKRNTQRTTSIITDGSRWWSRLQFWVSKICSVLFMETLSTIVFLLLSGFENLTLWPCIYK